MIKKFLFVFFAFALVGAGCFGGGSTAPTNGDDTGNGGEDVVDDGDDEPIGNIVLSEPQDGATVSSPITIRGEARVFENSVSWRLLDSDGNEISSGFTTADAPDVGQYGPFEERIFIPSVEDENITLQVLTYSANDGSPQDIVERDLTLESTENTSVNVFFSETSEVEAGDCSAVDFEKRTVNKTVNTAELAIRELLKGPEADWAESMIPEGATLSSVTIKDGVASVDFASHDISEWSGGSCRVTAIYKQIEQTLLQFPSVDSVEISVNGETEEILQP